MRGGYVRVGQDCNIAPIRHAAVDAAVLCICDFWICVCVCMCGGCAVPRGLLLEHTPSSRQAWQIAAAVLSGAAA